MIKFILGLFKSKINFTALLLFLEPILEKVIEFFQTHNFSGMTVQQIGVEITAFVLMILRTYFNKPIE